MKIKRISVRKILDSAGEWTIEAKLTLDNGLEGIASVPSGISEGRWEAKTVPTKQAIKEIKEVISPAVVSRKFKGQKELDGILRNLSCGANASLPVSLAFCRAAKTLTYPQKIISPKLLILIFEGAKHGNKDLSIQEFMIAVSNVEEGREGYRKIKLFLERKGLLSTVGAEGGFSPPGVSDEEILRILKEVLGEKQPLALDIAACHRGKQNFDYQKLIENHPIILLEDPYPDNKWTNWTNLTGKIGKKVLLVGDDLTATLPERIKEAVRRKAVGGVVIKPDQRKTLTEVLEAIEVAKKNNLRIVISHRGRETNETFIADLAVAVQADYVKFGAPVRGERVAKYNRLLEILREY